MRNPTKFKYRLLNLNNVSALIGISVFSAILVILRNYIPINLLSLPFDDELFVRRADVVLKGELYTFTSGYNPLVKGVAYPWLLVVSNFLNVNPVTLVFSLLVLVIFFLLAFTLKSRHIIILCLTFMFVLLDPSPFKAPASRIARESFYQLSLLALLTLIILIFIILEKRPSSKYLLITISIFSGFIFFVVQNIREERIWIYLNFTLFFSVLTITFRKKTKEYWMKTAFILLIIFASYFLFMTTLKYAHDNIYEVKLTSSTIEGEFPKLLSNLSSIDVGEPDRQYVSITKQKRDAAYSVSPTFTKLQNYLEGPGGMWVQFGCENSGVCDDYANSFFHIALREAIKLEGFWGTQLTAQNFMSQVNFEIEAACTDKAIYCVTPLPLARGLGVTQISTNQIFETSKYLNLYFFQSLKGWDTNYSLDAGAIKFREGNYYTYINEDSWIGWRDVIRSLPDAQEEYASEFNYRTGKALGYIELWNFLYSIFLQLGLIIFFIMNTLWFLKKIKQKEIKFIVLISDLFFLVWITRGLLLSFNSVTNLISISEYYSLPGRVFLPLSISLACAAFLMVIYEFREKYKNNKVKIANHR